MPALGAQASCNERRQPRTFALPSGKAAGKMPALPRGTSKRRSYGCCSNRLACTLIVTFIERPITPRPDRIPKSKRSSSVVAQ